MLTDGLYIPKLRETMIKLDRKQLLSSKEHGWCRRFMVWLDQNNIYNGCIVLEPSRYMDHLRGLKLRAHQVEVSFLCKIFRLSGYNVNFFEQRRWKTVEPLVRTRKSLPTTEVICSNLLKLTDIEGLFVLLLYVSGRRSIDLIRLKTSNITVVGDTVDIILEYCKTKKKLSSYSFSIVHDLPIDDAPYLKILADLLVSSRQPFENICMAKIAGKLSFTPHTLRSSRAIHLVLNGLSVPEVMSRIGWSDIETYKHYVRLPTSSILKLQNYDAVVLKINSQL